MAVSQLGSITDMAASWNTEEDDNEGDDGDRETRRELVKMESSQMDTTGLDRDINSEEDKGMVEEFSKQLHRSHQENLRAKDDGYEYKANFSISSACDYDGASCYSSENYGDNGKGEDFCHSVSSDELLDDGTSESDEMLNFFGFMDENSERTGIDSDQEMPEFENTAEDEYSSDDDDDDDDDVDYLEKKYFQPSYPMEVFSTLEEMKQSFFLTDLSLSTSTGNTFHVHSLVLAAVSTLVQQKLRERDLEAGKPLCLSLEVSDLGLSAVLEFAYSGAIHGLNQKSLDLIQTAALCMGAPRVLELCKEEQNREKGMKEGKGMEEKMGQTSAEEQMVVNLESIRTLWEDRVGCDVELEADGRIFRAHKVILSATSDYFRAMLSSGMRECQQTAVSLQLVGAHELLTLVHCSYSGVLFLDWGCVFELTCTALQLQFKHALSLCFDFILKEIDGNSCLDVLAFAEAYAMRELEEMAEDFTLRHFEVVASTLKFQDLPVEKLKTYLYSKSLCVTSELPVFKAVVSWIEANPKKRVKEARELMRAVQFSLMTFKEFKEVKAICSWPKVSTKDLYESLLEEFCSDTLNIQSDFRTYLPKETLILVGGERITENLDKRTPCREMWFSNSFRNHVGLLKRVEWRLLGELPEKPRFNHSVGVIRGKLYVVGGRHYYGKTDIMKCVHRYDPFQDSWQRLADMREKRGSFALVIMDEKIYAMGGDINSEANVESVEVYCPVKDSWSLVHPLDQPLSGHAASTWNGQIFISGGFDSRYQCLASMTLYHPEKGTTYLTDMFHSRAQHCMETLQARLYVAGGVSHDDGQLLDQLECETYDPVSNIWSAIMPLSVPHVSAASAVLEGKIYIIGGYCEEDFSDTRRVHRYDPERKHWENMCGTPGPSTYIAACVLSIPAHLRQ